MRREKNKEEICSEGISCFKKTSTRTILWTFIFERKLRIPIDHIYRDRCKKPQLLRSPVIDIGADSDSDSDSELVSFRSRFYYREMTPDLYSSSISISLLSLSSTRTELIAPAIGEYTMSESFPISIPLSCSSRLRLPLSVLQTPRFRGFIFGFPRSRYHCFTGTYPSTNYLSP